MRVVEPPAELVVLESPGCGSARGNWALFVTAGLLITVLIGGAVNGKLTSSQGGEYFNIARALYHGHGYANPFGRMDGPTAWMAPVFPTLLAGLHWLGEGNREVVT